MRFQKGNDIGKRTQFKSGEEAAKNGQKGGIKSGESKRHAKTLREAMKNILEMKHSNGATGAENIIVALYEKALTGDVAATKLFGEMMDELKKRIELNSDQPFQVKVIETTEELNSKINDYLNG